MRGRQFGSCLLIAVAVAAVLVSSSANAARDAAFLDPGAAVSPTARSSEAIVVEPKSDSDVGDTPPNLGRRATFFFVNQTNLPVSVESIAANGDSNVRADIVSDDCSKEKQIGPGSRCSVTVEATPIGSGSWTAELLLTHNAAGRIARARVIGRTAAGSADKRDMGLSLNTKDSKPVDFGEVVVGTGKAVRSALMVNDSNDIISILSIEVIAAENGLQRLEQGCEPDMDLKMGESCPVTLVWKPETKSNVSTDLIIRHSGRLGFAVIPIRGTAKEGAVSASSSQTAAPQQTNDRKGGVQPPSVADLTQLLTAETIPPVSERDLPEQATGRSAKIESLSPSLSLDAYRLIGTVGNRALIYKPDGSTAVVAVGDEIDSVGDKAVKLVNISPKDAEIFFEGKKKLLKLDAVPALTDRARSTQREPSRGREKGSNHDSDQNQESVLVPLPTGTK